MAYRPATPAKVTILQDRRKAMLEATRGLIQRITSAKDKRALIAELNTWADTIVNTLDSEAKRTPTVREGMLRTNKIKHSRY